MNASRQDDDDDELHQTANVCMYSASNDRVHRDRRDLLCFFLQNCLSNK